MYSKSLLITLGGWGERREKEKESHLIYSIKSFSCHVVLTISIREQLAEAAETLEQCLADLAAGAAPRPDAEALGRHKSAAWDETLHLLSLLRLLILACVNGTVRVYVVPVGA